MKLIQLPGLACCCSININSPFGSSEVTISEVKAMMKWHDILVKLYTSQPYPGKAQIPKRRLEGPRRVMTVPSHRYRHLHNKSREWQAIR